MDYGTFARLVREAIGSLYDHPYLERHPLTEALVPESAQETAGLTLHRLLVEAIEALRPPAHVPRTVARWRPYLTLYLRYVEGLDPSQVADELCISGRQFRREQSRGLTTLTARLWKRYVELHDQLAEVLPPQSLLDAEVERLSVASSGGTALVQDIVGSVVSTLAGLAARQHTQVASSLPNDLPRVAIDRVVFRQILLNVLAHTIEQATNARVEVTAREAGPQVELSICCQSQKPARLLMAEGDDRLTVAARLVRMWGGQFSPITENGLTIRLRLPVRQPATVLIVDDNPEVIQLFQRYLGGGAYYAVGATSSQEALRLAREIRPDAITLDIMMPSQDGWEILQNLKNLDETKHIPVILCSVLREQTLALSLGATDFVAKPVTQQKLLAALARCISKPADAARPDSPSHNASAPQPKSHRGA
mgnify:CR=1 FL=1